MRHINAAVLLSTLAPSIQVAAGSLPRGVGPEWSRFYNTGKDFVCINQPSVRLDQSQINDNSCDCPDGSDEPGTSACSYLDTLSPQQPLPGSLSGTTNTTNTLPGFWCENKGHIGAYIPFLYINDGVCDYEVCCDGSDESAHVGGIKCPNKCDEIGKEHRRVEDLKKQSRERSARKRSTMVKEAKELRRRVEARITTLNEEIKGLEAKKEDLQKKLKDVETSERGKVVKPEGTAGPLGVLLGLAKQRVGELRNALDKVLDQRDDALEKVEELENILRKFREEYNPNFNDEGVKAAVKAWDDYAAKAANEKKDDSNDSDFVELLKEDGENSGINWSEFQEEETYEPDALYNLEAYLPAAVRDYIHDRLNLLRIWLIENGILADNPSGKKGESRLVAAAREALQSAENEVNVKTSERTQQENDLTKNYGADDIFRYLKDKCITIDTGEYTYEHCWMDKTTQKSKKGHGDTNMGYFTELSTEEADEEDRADGKGLGRGPRTVLKYDNGQSCWNGPNRRTDVWLACAETEEIWRVVEAEKCVYRMEVGTPAACDNIAETGAKKDEL